MIDERLEGLKLPDALSFTDDRGVVEKGQWDQRRKEIQQLLCSEEYGFFPPAPKDIKAETIKEDDLFCAGKAILRTVLLTVTLENREFSFPICCCIPKSETKVPAFLHIHFRDCVPDKYMPSEEISDNGFATVSFCYSDVTADNCDFTDGLAGVLYGDTAKDSGSPGKIMIWAWAAMRVMDYMQTMDSIDKKNIAVVGHSRLGKTALLTGAFDERFAFVISNNSGCSGAALSRGNSGERIEDICREFPYWFCESYKKYAGREESLPFDQHFLLSLIAPRKLYVASAEEDSWADPCSEFLACVATGAIYELLGETGCIHPNRFPQANESMHDGGIGYHIRKGNHYLSRYDWQQFMEYIQKHRNRN